MTQGHAVQGSSVEPKYREPRKNRRTTVLGKRTMELLRGGHPKATISRDGLVGGIMVTFHQGDRIVPPSRLERFSGFQRFIISLAEMLTGLQLAPAYSPFYLMRSGVVETIEYEVDPKTHKKHQVTALFPAEAWQECLRTQMWAWEKSGGTAELPISIAQDRTVVVFFPNTIPLWLMNARMQRVIRSLQASLASAKGLVEKTVVTIDGNTLLGLQQTRTSPHSPTTGNTLMLGNHPLAPSEGDQLWIVWDTITRSVIQLFEIASDEDTQLTFFHLPEFVQTAAAILHAADSHYGQLKGVTTVDPSKKQSLNLLRAKLLELMKQLYSSDIAHNRETADRLEVSAILDTMFDAFGEKPPSEEVIENDPFGELETTEEAAARVQRR